MTCQQRWLLHVDHQKEAELRKFTICLKRGGEAGLMRK
uniref:Uncharacterized protein n=1 Tax=Rhizophora mucronata TaxID=61149 RepID=A0A2P2J9X1_RHIMU